MAGSSPRVDHAVTSPTIVGYVRGTLPVTAPRILVDGLQAGGVWMASPIATEVVCVEEGGRITHRVAVSNHAFACMLGGDERRTMFVLTADSSDPAYCREHASGRVEVFTADVPGAGRP